MTTTPRTMHADDLVSALKGQGTALAGLKESLEALGDHYAKMAEGMKEESSLEEFMNLQEPKSCTHGYFCEACPGCAWDEVDEII